MIISPHGLTRQVSASCALSAAFALVVSASPFTFAVGSEPYSGPAQGVKVHESTALVDFSKEAPGVDSPRELRLVLKDAVPLKDIQKQGIPGGGGVREVSIPVLGDLTLTIPLSNGQPDYQSARGEVLYLGANRISFSGPLQEDSGSPFRLEGRAASGSLRFPMEIKSSASAEPLSSLLEVDLDLKIQEETFEYTPDPDPSIPPWRSSKVQPSGNLVTGTWRAKDAQGDKVLSGSIEGPDGCYRLARTSDSFFPIQAIDLTPTPEGMHVKAFAAPHRVDWHEAQWAVREFTKPVDLTAFNGLRLKVKSDAPSADGKPVPAVAVAFRVAGQPWFSCRTVVPLLGGEREHIVDFDLFERGAPNPGVGAGPNQSEFPDLSQVDAIAIGVANPFGVGQVDFTALSLDAVRHKERGHGVPPTEPVKITVDATVKESFAGVDTVPKGLFGYHLANTSAKGKNPPPAWFEAPPVSGDGGRLLELTRPGSLRPLDHTSMTGEQGAGKVRPLPADMAKRGEALDAVMHTITNENLWSRPRWMDTDPDQYAEGIREMFRHVGRMAWTPEQPDNTLRYIEFWNEPFMWARHINRGNSTHSAGPGDPGGNRGRKAWDDPTQFTYMPGKLGAEMYAKFFNAAAEGLRETNPHVQIGGMSSGVFGEDFFSQLTNYVAHFIAASKDHIDFLTEHHYSSHAPSTAAAYETLTAWTLAKHGKRWPIWNTEANDLADIAPGDQRSPEAAKALTDQNRAYYNYRDILELILKSRDKAMGRALHAFWGAGWFRNEGEQLMYLHTAALRGAIVSSQSDDPAILPVATWENGRLAIYLLNDSPFPRQTSVAIQGAGPGAEIEASGLRLNADRSALAAFSSPIKATHLENLTEVTFEEPLAPREITKLLVSPVPKPAKVRHTTQSFADLVISDISPGQQAKGTISIQPGSSGQPSRAILRVVARDTQTGEATIQLAGTRVAIPATTAEGNHHIITDLPLDLPPAELARLTKDKTLSFEASSAPESDGWTLYSLSLLMEDEPVQPNAPGT